MLEYKLQNKISSKTRSCHHRTENVVCKFTKAYIISSQRIKVGMVCWEEKSHVGNSFSECDVQWAEKWPPVLHHFPGGFNAEVRPAHADHISVQSPKIYINVLFIYL